MYSLIADFDDPVPQVRFPALALTVPNLGDLPVDTELVFELASGRWDVSLGYDDIPTDGRVKRITGYIGSLQNYR